MKCILPFPSLGFLVSCSGPPTDIVSTSADQTIVANRGPAFTTFETGQVRPLALSADGQTLFAVNTPDNRLEIFDVSDGGNNLRQNLFRRMACKHKQGMRTSPKRPSDTSG